MDFFLSKIPCAVLIVAVTNYLDHDDITRLRQVSKPLHSLLLQVTFLPSHSNYLYSAILTDVIAFIAVFQEIKAIVHGQYVEQFGRPIKSGHAGTNSVHEAMSRLLAMVPPEIAFHILNIVSCFQTLNAKIR